jgi:hypothetical protein
MYRKQYGLAVWFGNEVLTTVAYFLEKRRISDVLAGFSACI